MDRNRKLAVVSGAGELDEETCAKIRSAFIIGDERHAESDPRCGLLMLAEIADRALSPAVNDPGTAIAVLGAQLRLLTEWADSAREPAECIYPGVEVPGLNPEDLLEDAFSPIARDGAGMFEVASRLQKTFIALAALGHFDLAAASRIHSGVALEQALAKLPTEYHRHKLRQIAGFAEAASAKDGSGR